MCGGGGLALFGCMSLLYLTVFMHLILFGFCITIFTNLLFKSFYVRQTINQMYLKFAFQFHHNKGNCYKERYVLNRTKCLQLQLSNQPL